MKKNLILFACVMLSAIYCFGQNGEIRSHSRLADSLKEAYLDQAALRYPALRQLNISTDIIFPGEINSQLNHQPLFKGNASTIRTTTSFTLPIIAWAKNSFSVTASYAQARLEVNDLQSFQPALSNEDLIFNKSTFGVTPSFQRIDSLFGRQVFLRAMVTGLSNDFRSLKRVSYLFTAVFPLKQTAKTSFSIGIVGNIDPSIKIPVFLLINYWHKFDNNIEFNFNLPSQVSFRKPLSDKLWVTLGTTLGGSVAFFNLDYLNLPRDANYTTIDLKTGASIEYKVGRKLIFSIGSGVLTPLSARAFDRTKSTSDYFLKNTVSNAPYINFGFSVLPFLR